MTFTSISQAFCIFCDEIFPYFGSPFLRRKHFEIMAQKSSIGLACGKLVIIVSWNDTSSKFCLFVPKHILDISVDC